MGVLTPEILAALRSPAELKDPRTITVNRFYQRILTPLRSGTEVEAASALRELHHWIARNRAAHKGTTASEVRMYHQLCDRLAPDTLQRREEIIAALGEAPFSAGD